MVTRRTTVITFGTLLAGGGAVLGTGAFDTVETQRSVSLETADDADAFLAFEIIDDEHVSQTGGTIDFELVTAATTTFSDLVNVRNQGTQTVTSLRFEFDVTGGDQPPSAVEDAMRIVSGDATIDAVDEANLLIESDAGGADDDRLSPGEAIPFGIEVDLTGTIDQITGNPEITLTIIAETGDKSGDGNDDDGSDGGAGGTAPAFVYADGPSRDPPNTPPQSLTFQLENTGGAATIDGFAVDIDRPGNSPAPETFDGFEIDPAAAGEPTRDESDTDDDLEVGEEVRHASYAIPAGSTASYTIETFDQDPSQKGELDLTILTGAGRVDLPSTGFESPGNG